MTDDFTPLKAILDDFEKFILGPEHGEQPADVYAYYNLMLRAQKAFRDIGGRWSSLVQWDLMAKLPTTKPKLEGWIAFQKIWTERTGDGAFAGFEDMARLREEAQTLHGVETQAAKIGFDPGSLEPVDVPTEAEQNKAVIDATVGSDREFAKLHAYNVENLNKAKQLAADAAKRLGDLPTSAWAAIPWYYKAGGLAAFALLVISATRR